jgi:hypothetical protein
MCFLNFNNVWHFLIYFFLMAKITKLESILLGMIIYVPIEKLRTLIQHYTSWCFSKINKKLQMVIIITASTISILFVNVEFLKKYEKNK